MLSDRVVFLLKESAQHRVPGGSVTLFEVVLNDPLQARLGVSTGDAREWLTLSVGEHADVAGIGRLELVDVRIAPPGKSSSVVLDLLPV